MDKEIANLENVEIIWPSLTKKSKMSDKYEVTLVNLTEQQVKMLEAIGLTVRDGKKEGENEDRGMWILAKSNFSPFPSNVFDGRGTPPPPKGTLFPAEEAGTIGNGTIAHVQVMSYGWGKYAKTGNERSCGLQKLKIIKLESSGGGDPFGDASDDPF